jgi:hypothetical protein
MISAPLIKASIGGIGKMEIMCNGKVHLKMNLSARYSNEHLIYISYKNYGNVSISGGELNIDLKNKLPYGIRIDALGIKNGKEYQDLGGYLNITAKVTISNVYADYTSNGKAAGIIVNGVFEEVYMENTNVKNVSRVSSFLHIPPNVQSDETKGIAIINLKGNLELINPKVENVTTPNDRDADGIAVFGYKPNYNPRDENYKTLGKAIISDAVIIDAQGRGIKIQCSDVKIVKPFFLRKNVKSIIHGNDIDFQWGNGIVENSTHEYISVDGFNPISSKDSYNCIVFQNKLKDSKMTSKVFGAKFKSEVPVANFITLITGKDAQSWTLKVDNIHLDEKNSNLINRSFVEFSANESYGIPSMNSESIVSIDFSNVRTSAILTSYTGFTGKRFSQKVKVTFDSKDIFNSKDKKLFQNISGQNIQQN